MNYFSEDQKYEDAKIIRDQIKKLEYITRPRFPAEEFIKNPNLIEDIRADEIKKLKKLLLKFYKIPNLKRIECYDVAHLSGTKPTASMVTFIDGVPAKRHYRHFKIDIKHGGNDISSMMELAERRVKHLGDWGIPNLIVVDGGRAQVGIFWAKIHPYEIPIIGIAKKYEKLVVPHSLRNKLAYKEKIIPKGPALNLLQRLRDEAHRFARRLHHKLIQKEFIMAK